jgi:hypothetical protein
MELSPAASRPQRLQIRCFEGWRGEPRRGGSRGRRNLTVVQTSHIPRVGGHPSRSSRLPQEVGPKPGDCNSAQPNPSADARRTSSAGAGLGGRGVAERRARFPLRLLVWPPPSTLGAEQVVLLVEARHPRALRAAFEEVGETDALEGPGIHLHRRSERHTASWTDQREQRSIDPLHTFVVGML